MLEIKHFISKGPREDAFPKDTLYRNEPFTYRAELRHAHQRYTSRFAKEVAELNILIDGIAPAGLIPNAITPLQGRRAPTPDFELQFGNTTVYCECTNAGDPSSMLWRFSVADLQIAANEVLQQNPDLVAKLDSRYIAFIPSSPIRPDDIPVVADEIASFIASEDIEHYGTRYGVRVPKSFPLLARSGAVAYTGESQHPAVVIQQPASAFGGPTEGVYDILRVLQQKQRKQYAGFRPIWLVIGTSDVIAPLAAVVAEFITLRPSIAPFQCVFLATSRESFVLSDAN